MAAVREQIQPPTGHSFRVLRWQNNLRDVELVLSPASCRPLEGEGTHWHYHQAFELTLLSSGDGTRFVGDSIEPFSSGDLVLLGDSLPHYWHARGASSGISIQWDFPLGHPFWTFPETAALVPLFDAAARGIHFSGAGGQLLAGQLIQLIRTDQMERLTQLFRILTTAAAVSSGERRALSRRNFAFSDESRHQHSMRAAIRLLLTDFRGEVRLQQLLKVTGMSKPTFSRQFKRHAGKTLSQFLQEIRLDAARRELAETNRPITDVALGNGFSQVSFFNRYFRRRMNCSPSQYRARLRPPVLKSRISKLEA